ncbi:MAG: metalloprotease PmbA [Nitrosomonadales bacterium]|jgi:PmbA protein|nr:metalloprotease PmbA [Nitrosomonadales bacterium]
MIKILNYAQADLYELAESVNKQARAKGASESDVEIDIDSGTSVSVRMKKLESVSLNNDKSLSITVYFGKKRGVATTSDFSKDAITSCIEAACDIAKFTGEDKAFGLASSALFPKKKIELDLYHPFEESQDSMITKALTAEKAALGFDKRVSNSEGANFSTSNNLFVQANSNGFIGGFPSSRHIISCSVIAKDNSGMQRDYSYSNARKISNLKALKEVGEDSAKRALMRLMPKPIKTGRYPVIFESRVATSLLSSIVSASSGTNQYRKTSFLLNSLNKKIASESLTVHEDPYLKHGNATTYFDGDGVHVKPRIVIDKGYLKGYFLSSYSARRLKMETTGNAGGAHNLIVNSSSFTFERLLKKMGRGLVVTELLGQGLNMVTGDYSRGVAGFWVENGAIVHPVEEITIAGNMKDMLLNISNIGNDTYINSSQYIGSVLIDDMTIASGN